MNDDAMFEYLAAYGMTRPEEEKLRRQQAMVESLRQNAMAGPQGQMVGRVYVPPSFTQYAAQLGNAYGARKGQQGVDYGIEDLTRRRRADLDIARVRMNPAAALKRDPLKLEDQEVDYASLLQMPFYF